MNIIRTFIAVPVDYLTECFRRNLSESGFSSDKRITGYTKERIDFKSQTSEKELIHNLTILYYWATFVAEL